VPDIKLILSAAVARAERRDRDPTLEKFIGDASLAEGRLLDRERTTAAPVCGPGSGQAYQAEIETRVVLRTRPIRTALFEGNISRSM